jgi:hypothetical protein
MDVENRHKNAKKHLFSMWLHHCITQNGWLVSAAKREKCRWKHFFLTCSVFAADEEVGGRTRPSQPNNEWNENGMNRTASVKSILRMPVRPYDIEHRGDKAGGCRIALRSVAIVTATSATSRTAALVAAATAGRVSAAATATGPKTAVFGLVDLDGAAIQFRAIHFVNGACRVFVVRKGYEPESPRPARFAVSYYFRLGHLAKPRECAVQTLICRIPTQSTHKQFFRHPFRNS